MAKIVLDQFDRRIIAELQKDARITNVALAEKIGLSPPPCLRRVKRLEDEGIIRGWRVDLDRKALDLGVTVFVGVKYDRPQEIEASAFVAAIGTWPEVLSCQLVSGDMDFLLEVVVADQEAYQRFLFEKLLKLPHVRDVRSNFAIKTYKNTGRLPLAE
ncbi:Lrp/AsnC family transcriptional regulator [Bradyrhizobium sp. 2TAF24]|uniref:Lrp/AsnC family transcriptional regulator n=1 Tax=Bradyrhizobium sp. 2TAF24 TaxID=3233011 RepID=UPI003F93A51C